MQYQRLSSVGRTNATRLPSLPWMCLFWQGVADEYRKGENHKGPGEVPAGKALEPTLWVSPVTISYTMSVLKTSEKSTTVTWFNLHLLCSVINVSVLSCNLESRPLAQLDMKAHLKYKHVRTSGKKVWPKRLETLFFFFDE